MINDEQKSRFSSVNSYVPSKTMSSTCVICNNTLLEPVGCSVCHLLCCKQCLITFTIQNKKCPNGCTTFELLCPNKTSHPLLYNTLIECLNCKNLITLINYGIHIRKCSNEEKEKYCWNCDSKVLESSLVCKLFSDYQLTAKYISEISLEEDLPFLIQISYDNFKGYATELDKRLIVTDNEEQAGIFSQETVDKLPYLKIFKKKVWKFLGPHYDLGILVVGYGKWAGSMILDVNKKTILSNCGRTQGLYLTIRKRDQRLFFFKENSNYTTCNVNIIAITSLDNLPHRSVS